MLSLIKQVELNGISVAIQQHWVGVIDSNIFELRAIFSNKRMRGLYFHVDGDKYMVLQKRPKRRLFEKLSMLMI